MLCLLLRLLLHHLSYTYVASLEVSKSTTEGQVTYSVEPVSAKLDIHEAQSPVLGNTISFIEGQSVIIF